jgi:hypothetical protein
MLNNLSLIGSAIESYPLPILQKRERIGTTADFTQWLLLACDRAKVNSKVHEILSLPTPNHE